MTEYIIGDIYYDDGSPNWFCIPSLEDLDEYERIVRCRDCKHSETVWNMVYCNYDGPGRPRLVKPDGFCYRGEPRQ